MIEVIDLKKRFDELLIFDNISLKVLDGTGIFVAGTSGCGKTTLLRIIAGLDLDYCGDVIIDEKNVTEKVRPNQRNIAMVFQECALWNYMTVEKNMSYGMKIIDKDKIGFVAEGLRIDNLLHKYPEELSGGQAKRVSLARALLSEKKNLLLDEPLSNVDAETKGIIIDFLKDHYLDNRCIIYVTHDKEEIDELPFKMIRMQA